MSAKGERALSPILDTRRTREGERAAIEQRQRVHLTKVAAGAHSTVAAIGLIPIGGLTALVHCRQEPARPSGRAKEPTAACGDPVRTRGAA